MDLITLALARKKKSGGGSYDDTEIREEIAEANAKAEEAEAIAKGKATGYVFDTVAAMNAWLPEHSAELNLGDNLYIRATDVPDYWWDGTSAQKLETQKVDLTDYVKNTDYATSSSVGLIKLRASYGSNSDSSGTIYATTRTVAQYTTDTNSLFIGKGTLENLKEAFEFTLEDGTVVTKNIFVSPVE